jgi:hypothetical protein
MKTTCGAKTRNGTPCAKSPMPNGRCALHGGKSLKGEQHPNFKHGKFSDYLPQRLVKIYEDVQADDEHTLLSRNIRLREMFIRERLAMIDDVPDSAETWKQLREAVDELNKAYRNSDDGKVYGAIAAIENIIDERTLYFQAVEEIRIDLAEQRKDKQVISSIEQRGENAITAKELMVFMGAVLHVINNTVTNQTERIKVQAQIDNLFSSTPQRLASIVHSAE